MRKKRKTTIWGRGGGLWLLTHFVFICTVTFAAAAATAHTPKQVLEKYITMGLENNLVLKQREISLKKSLQALKEAKGMFWPSVSIEARYSRAGGGRVIEFPVGDLLNPVHHTLNQLLGAHGLVPVFPANLPNESIPFLRQEEHDTKLRVLQPLFQPGIYYNVKIKKDLTAIEKAKLNVFKRQLVADIKTAYYNHLKARKIKGLLNSTKLLLQENLRVSESLFKNHKRTEEVVFRSKAELSKLEQQRVEAEKNIQLSAAYFNFLLNRPLDAKIETEPSPGGCPRTRQKDEYSELSGNLPDAVEADQHLFPAAVGLKELEQHALNRRGEFLQLHRAIDAADHTAKLHQSGFLPGITAVLDYGFQGETYRFTNDDDYWMASLVLSWNLFRGGQDRAKKAQAALEKKRLEAGLTELENKIRLQVKEAFYNLKVTAAAVTSTRDMVTSRKEAFHIISKKYEQGMVPQIEYIKAQNDYTNASVSHIIAVFDARIKAARLERASAFYDFEKKAAKDTKQHKGE